jgi:hypothetical protein
VKLYCSVDLRASPSTPVLLNVLVVAGTMDVHSEGCGSFSVGTMTIFTNVYVTKIRGMFSALLIIVLEATRTSISALNARHTRIFLSISFQSDWSSLIVPQVVGKLLIVY